MSGQIGGGSGLSDHEREIRERVAAVMIEMVADFGYEATTVEEVCERAMVKRAQFHCCFADKEDCFVSLHDELVAEFCRRARTAFESTSSWHDRVWAAGWAAMRFLMEDPLRARFFVVEVNRAGARARARRDGVLERIADLLDAGREELEDPSSATRASAEFVAGAIYATILTRVEAGSIERGEDFLPELIYMAVMPYLGSRAAEDELLVEPLR